MSPRRMMGLGQWHRPWHPFLTDVLEGGGTHDTEAQEEDVSVGGSTKAVELVKLILQGSQAPKCYLLHQFSSAERPFEHFSGKGLAGNRKPTGGGRKNQSLYEGPCCQVGPHSQVCKLAQNLPHCSGPTCKLL